MIRVRFMEAVCVGVLFTRPWSVVVTGFSNTQVQNHQYLHSKECVFNSKLIFLYKQIQSVCVCVGGGGVLNDESVPFINVVWKSTPEAEDDGGWQLQKSIGHFRIYLGGMQTHGVVAATVQKETTFLNSFLLSSESSLPEKASVVTGKFFSLNSVLLNVYIFVSVC